MKLDSTIIIGAILILLGIEALKFFILEIIIENATKNGIKRAIRELKDEEIL